MGSAGQKSKESGDASGDMLQTEIVVGLAGWSDLLRFRRSGYGSGWGCWRSRMQATGTAACKAFLLGSASEEELI
jgi:hypothetical protein